MKVKILIDSASDINLAEAEDMGAELLPIEINFGEEQYSDGINLPVDLFYEKLASSAELPRTSQINQYAFEESFRRLTDEGCEVVAITLSSKLSGTYRSALAAAEKFADKVFVVDSLNASIGERLLCLYALRLIDGGLCAKDVAEKLDEAKTKINLMALLDTLLYLKKGGRISAVTAVAGQMLSIKPVIGIIGGEVKLVGKAMGSKKGNNLLNTLVNEKGVDFTMPYGVIYSGTDDSLLRRYITDSEHIWKGETEKLPVYRIGCTIGAHIGPNAIGVAFFQK